MGADGVGDGLGKLCGIGNLGAGDDEAFEFVMAVFVVVMVMIVIVVVVIVFIVVVVMVVNLVPRIEIGFGADALAEEHVDGQRAHGGMDHLHRVAGAGFQVGDGLVKLVRAEQVGLVHHDHVGAGDLVFEEFRERGFVIEVLVGGALGLDRGEVGGEAAFAHGRAIDHGDDTVDGEPRLGEQFGHQRSGGVRVVAVRYPVVHDHHAFVDLGEGRFAVPAMDWSGGGGACPPDALCEATSPASEVVTLEVDGEQLREVERQSVVLDGYQQATRALPAGDGWAVLGETQIVVLDGAGDEVGRVTLT